MVFMDQDEDKDKESGIRSTLNLVNSKHLSYFELMKSIIKQRHFSSLNEVRAVVSLSEKTGLKMTEWSYRKEDNIITFRCKRYPTCHSRLNFEINHCKTRKPMLANTFLKHNHPPDWSDLCPVNRNIWAVLSHPQVQEKLKTKYV